MFAVKDGINQMELEAIKKRLAELDNKTALYFSDFEDEPPTIGVFEESEFTCTNGEYNHNRSFSYLEFPVYFKNAFAEHLDGTYDFSIQEQEDAVTVEANCNDSHSCASSKKVVITFNPFA